MAAKVVLTVAGLYDVVLEDDGEGVTAEGLLSVALGALDTMANHKPVDPPRQ